MALATNSTPGEIILSGDFTGSNDGHAPELTPTGVIPGTYVCPDLVVDSKGRLLYCTSWQMPVATLTTLGGTVASGGILDVLDATTSTLGIVQIGSGLDVTAGVVSVITLDATTSSKGVVQIGSGLDVTAGVVSANTGTLSDATSSTKGVVQIGSGLDVTAGVVSIDESQLSDASAVAKGVVQVGVGLQAPAGILAIDLPDASSSTKGEVQVGSGINVAAGVISIPNATTTIKGIMEVGSGLLVSSGEISVDAPILTDSNNIFTAQQGYPMISYTGSNFSPDIRDSDLYEWSLTQHGTFQNLASEGAQIGRTFNVIIKTNGYNVTFGSGHQIRSTPNTVTGVALVTVIVTGVDKYKTIIQNDFI